MEIRVNCNFEFGRDISGRLISKVFLKFRNIYARDNERTVLLIDLLSIRSTSNKCQKRAVVWKGARINCEPYSIFFEILWINEALSIHIIRILNPSNHISLDALPS